MTTYPFNLKAVHPSWQDCLQQALKKIDPQYLSELKHIPDWLPGPQKIFNAFSIPLTQVKYVLFGESPYPRPESANGYAFWDAAVYELWSATGLDKKVNRATSLRNIIKMLLIAEGILDPKHTSQADIAHATKTSLIKTNEQLFQNFLEHGFLLLNTTLVLQSGPPQKDARAWQPFMKSLLNTSLEKKPAITFLLLGRLANNIDPFLTNPYVNKIYVEHPYNISFITEPKILKFFKPLHLLQEKNRPI